MKSKVSTSKNIRLQSHCQKSFLMDVYLPEGPNEMTNLVVFCHGFKGFKDWGAWGEIARLFAQNRIGYIKFNFSHNGTSLTSPTQLDQLDEFAANNYSKELMDLETVLDWIDQNRSIGLKDWNQLKKVHLIGHSRGGGLSLAAACKHIDRIHSVSCWASVSRLDYAWTSPGFIKKWKTNGYYEVLNSRTQQKLRLNYQLYEDYIQHQSTFDLDAVLRKLTIPVLLLHGDADPAVPLSSAMELNKSIKNSHLQIISGADHVFGMRHPFLDKKLPLESKKLVQHTLDFIKSLG